MAAPNSRICPNCGHVMTPVGSKSRGFSFKKALLGTVLFGTGGAAAGINGKKEDIYKCPHCGWPDVTSAQRETGTTTSASPIGAGSINTVPSPLPKAFFSPSINLNNYLSISDKFLKSRYLLDEDQETALNELRQTLRKSGFGENSFEAYASMIAQKSSWREMPGWEEVALSLPATASPWEAEERFRTIINYVIDSLSAELSDSLDSSLKFELSRRSSDLRYLAISFSFVDWVVPRISEDGLPDFDEISDREIYISKIVKTYKKIFDSCQAASYALPLNYFKEDCLSVNDLLTELIGDSEHPTRGMELFFRENPQVGKACDEGKLTYSAVKEKYSEWAYEKALPLTLERCVKDGFISKSPYPVTSPVCPNPSYCYQLREFDYSRFAPIA